MTILMIPDHNFDNPLSEVGQKIITIVAIRTKFWYFPWQFVYLFIQSDNFDNP